MTGLPTRPQGMSPGEFTHQRWVHEQIDPALRAVVADWPYARDEEIGGARVRFLHYPLTPGGFARFRTLETPADADALFGAGDADVVFYGHHHPFSDLEGATRYVNPGSLGCHHRPLARFAILDASAGGAPSLAFHAVPYDPAPLLAEFERRNVPERDFILRHFMPQP